MLRRILALIKKEFLIIWRDPKSRALIIAPPLMQLFLFAHAVTMEIKNIDLTVLDRDNSVHSRELVSRFNSSIWFKSITYAENEKALTRLIEDQKAQIALEINSDFSKNLLSKKPSTVQIIVDGRQTNSAAIASVYATQIISDYESEFNNKASPKINVVVRSWFNPNLEFLWYTLISLIALLALVITLLLTALSIARERELGTFDQLIVSPLSSFEILVGKTIPPLVIATILAGVMATIARIFFKLPFEGSLWLYFISTIFALLAIVGVGLFISSLCKTQQQAILGVFTFQMPAVLLSGFISPVEDMPQFFQALSWLDPIRFYMVIAKGVFLKDMPAIDVFANIIPLMIIALITLSAAGWMFKRKLD